MNFFFFLTTNAHTAFGGDSYSTKIYKNKNLGKISWFKVFWMCKKILIPSFLALTYTEINYGSSKNLPL